MRLGTVIRLLMIAACSVPLASAWQMPALALPCVDSLDPAVPFVPTHEEEKDEEDSERAQGAAGNHQLRPPTPQSHRYSHRPRSARITDFCVSPAGRHLSGPARSPSPLDPFRNGLGCPFRC
jgi:hypothetical protein